MDAKHELNPRIGHLQASYGYLDQTIQDYLEDLLAEEKKGLVVSDKQLLVKLVVFLKILSRLDTHRINLIIPFEHDNEIEALQNFLRDPKELRPFDSVNDKLTAADIGQLKKEIQEKFAKKVKDLAAAYDLDSKKIESAADKYIINLSEASAPKEKEEAAYTEELKNAKAFWQRLNNDRKNKIFMMYFFQLTDAQRESLARQEVKEGKGKSKDKTAQQRKWEEDLYIGLYRLRAAAVADNDPAAAEEGGYFGIPGVGSGGGSYLYCTDCAEGSGEACLYLLLFLILAAAIMLIMLFAYLALYKLVESIDNLIAGYQFYKNILQLISLVLVTAAAGYFLFLTSALWLPAASTGFVQLFMNRPDLLLGGTSALCLMIVGIAGIGYLPDFILNSGRALTDWEKNNINLQLGKEISATLAGTIEANVNAKLKELAHSWLYPFDLLTCKGRQNRRDRIVLLKLRDDLHAATGYNRLDWDEIGAKLKTNPFVAFSTLAENSTLFAQSQPDSRPAPPVYLGKLAMPVATTEPTPLREPGFAPPLEESLFNQFALSRT